MEARKNGVQVLVAQMNKNKKFQKEQLEKEGYTQFREFFREGLKAEKRRGRLKRRGAGQPEFEWIQ